MKTIYLVEGCRKYEDSWPLRAFATQALADKFLVECEQDRDQNGEDADYDSGVFFMISELEYVE